MFSNLDIFSYTTPRELDNIELLLVRTQKQIRLILLAVQFYIIPRRFPFFHEFQLHESVVNTGTANITDIYWEIEYIERDILCCWQLSR